MEEIAYPLEIVAYIIRRLISLGFRLLLWTTISATNPEVFDFRQIIAYFLIAGAVEDLTFTSTGGWDRSIRHAVKKGTLSNYLIKPVDILRFWYVSYIGRRMTITTYGLVSLLAGIVIFPPHNPNVLPLFCISLVFTAATGAGLNLLVGIVAFYTAEAGGISNVVDHITTVLSGNLIPINYFPTAFQKFVLLSPFPVLTYVPVSILQSGGFNHETFMKLGISLFWAICLLTLGNVFWKKAVTNYEGVGI